MKNIGLLLSVGLVSIPVGWQAEAIRATGPENQLPEVKAGKNAI
jgi:hypothetical protein